MAMIAARTMLLLLLCYSVPGIAQHIIDFPDVVNYSKQQYGGGSQSWDMRQDQSGILYFANNEGMLSFDGTTWKSYKLPNKTIARSLEIASDNKIYIGAQDELGYFSPDERGELKYHSLKKLMPENERSFADIWDIIQFDGDIFFRSSNRIYQYSDNQIRVYQTPAWQFITKCNGRLIAQDNNFRLLVFQKGSWVPLISTAAMPEEYMVTGCMSISRDSALLATLKDGLFILAGNQVHPLHSPGLDAIAAQRIYTAAPAGNGIFALGTTLGGCYLVDRNGRLLRHISREQGLQNNNILSLFTDRQQNLWLGLDNGIDLVVFDPAIRHFYAGYQNESTGYASLLFGKELYIGTSNGLYHAPVDSSGSTLQFQDGFQPVNGVKGQVWNLAEINGRLLMGHHEGAYLVEPNSVQLIDRQSGFWTFLPLQNILPASMIVAGNYMGLRFFGHDKSGFHLLPEKANFESARFITVENENTIWVGHPYMGLYRIGRREGADPEIRRYGEKEGLYGVNFLFPYRNKLLIATERGIMEYVPGKDIFQPNELLSRYLGKMSIRLLREDGAGNIWFVHDKSVGILDLSGPKAEIIHIPELNNRLVSGFEHINPILPNQVIIGGEKGFYLFNLEAYKKKKSVLLVKLRKVAIGPAADSTIFGGYFSDVDAPQEQSAGGIPRIGFQTNALHFEYTATSFGNALHIEYSYLLKGFDEQWSEWSRRSEKDYTNLPPGKYVFQFKARANQGQESMAGSYSFIILPPWYKSTYAYLGYVLLALLGIYLLYRWQEKRFSGQQQRHEEEQKKLQYLHQLEMEKNEKEIVKLRNEKLEAEIAHKNTELASSALHLVQKSELISKVKEDLSKQLKSIDGNNPLEEIKRMVRVLGDDERMDNEWESFALHFDKVHSDFLVKLKAVHPSLTANEIRLCAYLRMNLSTKEIAPLLNISVRGVEISRYRLRKKLQIPTEMNLFDYLIQIPG